jgi:DNA modification methylase
MVNIPATLEHYNIDSLIPYERNSRIHSDEQIARIAASIEEFGFTNPILIDGEHGIIAGHGRLAAAKKIGMQTVPVIQLAHLSDAQKQAYIIADNRLAELSEWNKELLAGELAELQSFDFDLNLIGFDDASLAEIMPAEKESQPLTDEDAVPEVDEQATPKTKIGDVWILGNHRLKCGDSTNEKDISDLMRNSRAVFCFTSPPYADMREYNGNKELSTIHLAKFLNAPCDLFAVNLGIQRKNNEINEYWNDYINYAKSVNLKFLSWNIWNRAGFGYTVAQATAMFCIDHEWIFVFGKRKELNKTIENKQSGLKKKGTIRQKDGSTTSVVTETSTHRQLGTVITMDVARYVGQEQKHPAMFPVELPEAYIEACSNIGEIIFEPFGGSGSTLIACEKTERKCFIMELDERYCDLIIRRWQDYTGKEAHLEATGETFNSIASI